MEKNHPREERRQNCKTCSHAPLPASNEVRNGTRQQSARPATLPRKPLLVSPATKAPPPARETVLKVIEFILSPKQNEGTLTPPIDGQELTDTNSDDDTLVSGPITLVIIPIELHFQPES